VANRRGCTLPTLTASNPPLWSPVCTPHAEHSIANITVENPDGHTMIILEWSYYDHKMIIFFLWEKMIIL
jgi:hypothetical protein